MIYHASNSIPTNANPDLWSIYIHNTNHKEKKNSTNLDSQFLYSRKYRVIAIKDLKHTANCLHVFFIFYFKSYFGYEWNLIIEKFHTSI